GKKYVVYPDITVDLRNNLFWDVSGGSTNHGTLIYNGARANIVNNYYKARLSGCDEACQKRVLVICQANRMPEDAVVCDARGEAVEPGAPAGGVYVSGNISGDGHTAHINAKGNVWQPHSAVQVDTQDACTAARLVLQQVGSRSENFGLDDIDRQLISTVTLAGCE
ncbi:MAG: hypothetical protein ACE5I2_07115, partial [Anaerolineae bacterium]